MAVMRPNPALDRPLAAWQHASGGGRVRARTLILVRWVGVLGQAIALAVVGGLFGFDLPWTAASVTLAASAGLNVWLMLGRRKGATHWREGQALFFFAFDLFQLTLMLYLTGGLRNPFCVLMLAPMTVSATVLPLRSLMAMTVLTLVNLALLAHTPVALPWHEDGLDLPPLWIAGEWIALTVAAVFVAAYAGSVAIQARRIDEALAVTQLALAREREAASLGALAAATAHELGTPLGTITVVAKEMLRELPPDSPLAEDAALLQSQAERCGAILAQLSRDPEAGDVEFTHLPLSALLRQIADDYSGGGVRVDIATDSRDGSREPHLAPRPDLRHGLANLVQNACQFAHKHVSIGVRWQQNGPVEVIIHDDGPGFSPHVLDRLGEPYLSHRHQKGNHLGLGVFIAATLLGHTGAHLHFDNHPRGGAEVAIHWPDHTFFEELTRTQRP